MIDVYSWATPNGHKVHIMLEECGLQLGRDWRVHPINIGAGDQFQPDFLRISPNNKIPALVDAEGPDGQPISLFESGAILLYLAAKTGKFLPKTDRAKYEVLQWLMFQMGGVGPMLGQAHHFRIYAPEKIDYAINRYTNEARRLYGVMDKQLATHRYIAGDDYTIADIAIYPWLRSWQNQGIDWADYPKLKKWFNAIGERPAVQRGVQVLADQRKPLVDDKAREMMFGATQYQRR
jgi:GST-like protein